MGSAVHPSAAVRRCSAASHAGRPLSWLAAAVLAGACGTAQPPPEAHAAALRVDEVLAGDAAGYAVADAPRPFVFPDDHGPHPDFRNEWWYLTGSLADEEGRPLGFQITFFRTALAPTMPPRASRWATRQVYMAHLALTDPDGAGFRAHEAFARGALDLAGARVRPFRVWLGGWELASLRPEQDDAFPARIRAASGDDAIDLVLAADKPFVLQGDAGLSRKGAEPADASYYYSYTRLRATGSLRVAGREHRVRGSAWMDREWSTSALEPGQTGWDWFALQLDDGRDLMLYVLRRDDGTVDAHSAGTLVAADGAETRLAREDFEVRVLDDWTSPESGVRYPSRWRLALPGEDLTLEVEPLLAGQELDLAFRYWEGAVRVSGRAAASPVAGRGYVELTGYSRESVAGVAEPSSSDQRSERSNR